MNLQKIIDRNYKANVKRGKINEKTTFREFCDKIYEEVNELDDKYCFNDNIDPLEMADIILVVLSMAKHFNIDIQKALEEKTIINEERAKNGK